MRNIKVNISVDFNETDDPLTEAGGVEQMGDGSFRLVFEHEDEFNIDRLENAALNTCYPALREALSKHLTEASKKSLSTTGIG